MRDIDDRFDMLTLTQRQKLLIANCLHVLATWLYILFLAAVFIIWMEIWKGLELLRHISNPWFSFGGAREMFGYAIVVLVAGRIVDEYAKRLNPRLRHNPERGWHYRHK